MKKPILLASILLIAPLVLTLGLENALATPGDSQDRPDKPHTPDLNPSHPNLPNGKPLPSEQNQVSSLNWAGYAISGPVGSVTDAKSSWKVPNIMCSSKTSYAAFWTGIDGYTSSTVEQTGVLAECYHGHPYYYTWYEFYPASPVYVTSQVPVKAGDIVYGEVSYSSGLFTVTLTDQSTGKTFSTTQSDSSAQLSSAEWIVEAPASGSQILPLANFGNAYYGLDYTTISSTNSATVSGTSGTIGSFGSAVNEMTMVTNNLTVKAQTSTLTSDGTSFSDTWKHS